MQKKRKKMKIDWDAAIGVFYILVGCSIITLLGKPFLWVMEKVMYKLIEIVF